MNGQMIVHQAGAPNTNGLQHCTHCRMTLDTGESGRGWEDGAKVIVLRRPNGNKQMVRAHDSVLMTCAAMGSHVMRSA